MPTENEAFVHHVQVVIATAQRLLDLYHTAGKLPFGEDASPLLHSSKALYSMCAAPRPREPKPK